jgi:hypothetical protein
MEGFYSVPLRVSIRSCFGSIPSVRGYCAFVAAKAHEKEKKRKYFKSGLEQRRHFTPFVVSTDGLIGKEAKTLLKKLSSLLADKWEKPYSVVCGYVNAQLSIAIVRATHHCLRGPRISYQPDEQSCPQWEDKAGLGLFRNYS